MIVKIQSSRNFISSSNRQPAHQIGNDNDGEQEYLGWLCLYCNVTILPSLTPSQQPPGRWCFTIHQTRWIGIPWYIMIPPQKHHSFTTASVHQKTLEAVPGCECRAPCPGGRAAPPPPPQRDTCRPAASSAGAGTWQGPATTPADT